MPKREVSDDQQFSLDEIIAEFKSGGTPEQPSRTAERPPHENSAAEAKQTASYQAADIPRKRQDGSRAEPEMPFSEEDAPPGVLKSSDESRSCEASPPKDSSGRHARPDPPSVLETLLADFPDEEQKPAEKAAPPTAPWRTAPKRPEPVIKEPEPEPEIMPEPEKEKKPPLPYDLMNVPTDDPTAAAEKLAKAVRSIAARLLLLMPVFLVSLYLTVAGPLSLPIPFGFTYINYPFWYMLTFCILQGLALILASPCTVSGFWRLFHGRPTLDTMVLFSGLCSLAHSVSVILKPEWGGYLPYTCVSVLTLMFGLIQKRQRAAALRRSYKAVVMGTVPTGVKLHVDGNHVPTAVKTSECGHAELSDLAQPDTTERFSGYYAPLAMVCCLAFAAVASFGVGHGGRFVWALSAISSVSAPACLLISASAPGKRLSKKLFTSGSMLLSGQSAQKLSKARTLVLDDGDLFPAGSVALAGMKIADNQSPDTVIACVAAMVQEIPGGLSLSFADLQRQQYVPPLKAEELRFFESGGISAKVSGNYALLGSASFLMRMGVRVSEGLKLKNSLFLALNGSFAGIFSMRYGVQPSVYAAFGLLRRARIRPVLAVRDFNLTQAFVEDRFELRPDSTDYPVFSDRIKLSAPSYARDLPTLALLTRDGLLPAAEAVAAAGRLTYAARVSRRLGLISAIIGMMLLYFLTYRGAFAAAAPYNVLLYLLLWTLPSDLISRLITSL